MKTINMARPLLFATLALLASAPAFATDEDHQAWGAATATINANDRLVIWLEGQVRASDDASRVGQTLIRPAIGIKLDPQTTAFVGYAYVFTDPEGPAESREHRLWQQLSFRIAGDGQGLTVTGRTRLEQRWMENGSGTGLRLRQQVRATAPLSGKVRAVAWTEPFINLNSTSWGQRYGIDRWRNFAGVSVPLSSNLTLEPGYLNQYVVRRGTDAMQHIASVTLNARF